MMKNNKLVRCNWMERLLLKLEAHGATFLLKATLIIIGIIVLALCLFWLPWTAIELEKMYPEFSFLKYPLLVGIYLTTIPFYFALNQTFKILSNIDSKSAFSKQSIDSLRFIKYCAFIIAILYFIGFNGLRLLNAANPGVLLLGLVIMFASAVIGVFAAILQRLMHKVMTIKNENELTI